MFAIGDAEWPGLSKLAEEAGETLQVIGKLMGNHGSVEHWDGGAPLDERLADELGDLFAATWFSVGQWPSPLVRRFEARYLDKLRTFERWHREQRPSPSPFAQKVSQEIDDGARPKEGRFGL